MPPETRKLDQRQNEVLATIVRLFIETGVPAGSKSVACLLESMWSSATIRSVMAELEGEGFLVQPHVSAGRVPTDRAYRYYVDWLAEARRLAPETEKFIEESLEPSGDEPEQLMARTSEVLAQVSKHVGIVLGPALEENLLEHIKFVSLPERRVLAVIVSRPDLFENKVISLSEEFSQQELDRAAEFLNDEFRGWSLWAIRVEIFNRLERMKTLCDRMVSTVAVLFQSGALGREEMGRLFVDGTEALVDQPDFADSGAFKELLKAFEEKVKVVKLLSACLQTPGTGVVTVIGRENPAHEMQNCAVIVAPYRYRNRVVGALGVVGPTRIEYDRAIPTVDYVAHLCTRLLSAS
ncbi:MAG: heat-inducible transcription repressor HrcA [Acidobacteria bacterium]|nr:heat-inducible transcription repressor HrcA [Acidobacteriota bacterium]